MINGHSNLRAFGACRLDLQKKVLWADDRPVPLPLKAIELLCVLVEGRGEIVTKQEIWQDVWRNAFVEETNLTHNIYLLRKALKDLGERDVIETVPRRGYRFCGEVHDVPDEEIVLERHALTRTTIEFEDARELQISPSLMNAESKRATARVPGVAFALAGIGLVALLGVGLVWDYRAAASPTSASTIRSLAVLPFREIDPGRTADHHGLGLADMLITRLGSIKSISVRPTSAVTSFEDSGTDSITIGKKLQVDAVMEGSLYRTDRDVRVTMRLLNVADGRTIWSGEFEKLVADVSSVDKEISLKAAEALSLNLSATEQTALARNYTTDADAYELYLKGRSEWSKRNRQGMIDGEHFIRTAIDKDPNFALAYVGLADSTAMRDDWDQAKGSLQKAISLDPQLGEAHASLGFIRMFHEWNWRAAETEFKKAIDLNPGYARAHHWYAILLEIQGRNSEAEAEFQKALEIDPLSYNILGDLGQAYYSARKYDKAREYCNQALEIYPDFMFAHEYLSAIDLQMGDMNGAIEEKLKADSINTLSSDAAPDQQAAIEKTRAETVERYKKLGYKAFIANRFVIDPASPNSFYIVAKNYAFLGKTGDALDALENAYRSHATYMMPFVKADPVFDPLRNEPRYQALLQKMGLAENE